MPEGDTILRTATNLRRWLEGRRITAATTRLPRLAGSLARLTGSTVVAVEPTGKHLLIRFSTGDLLHSHMGMTGSWHVYPAGERWRRPASQSRVVLEAGDRLAVCFNAPVVELLSGREERVHPSLARLGPDVLGPEPPDADEISRRAAVWRTAGADLTAGEVLLDQRVVSGIGNIYRCESLFLCGVHPWTLVEALGADGLAGLVMTASRLMRANVARRTVAARAPGSRPDRRWVYGRAGRPCRRCGTPIHSARLGSQARTVYWCPTCQPVPAEPAG